MLSEFRAETRMAQQIKDDDYWAVTNLMVCPKREPNLPNRLRRPGANLGTATPVSMSVAKTATCARARAQHMGRTQWRATPVNSCTCVGRGTTVKHPNAYLAYHTIAAHLQKQLAAHP